MTKLPASAGEPNGGPPPFKTTSVDAPRARRKRRSRNRPVWVRAVRIVSYGLAIPGAVGCVALMIHVIVDVAGRSFFNHPIKGTLEITQYWWMMTIVFAGFGYTQLRGEHIRATVITELLSRAWQRGAEIMTIVLLGGLSLFLAYHGWNAALHSFALRETSNSSPPIAIWPFVFLVPLGCVALTLQCLASIYDVAAANDSESHAEELI